MSFCFLVSSEWEQYHIAIILQLFIPQIRPHGGLFKGGGFFAETGFLAVDPGKGILKGVFHQRELPVLKICL